MSTETAIQRAVAIVGSQVALGAALGVGKSAVNQWVKGTSVPMRHCPAIERLTGGKVRCEDLCPDMDWSALRNPKRRRAKSAEVA